MQALPPVRQDTRDKIHFYQCRLCLSVVSYSPPLRRLCGVIVLSLRVAALIPLVRFHGQKAFQTRCLHRHRSRAVFRLRRAVCAAKFAGQLDRDGRSVVFAAANVDRAVVVADDLVNE